MIQTDPAVPFVLVVIILLASANLVEGTCEFFYHYVPLEAGYSPPCDPSGVNVALHCSGYSPPSANVELVWQWRPDSSTSYSEASFFFHFNWNPSSSTSVPSSGPYAGDNYHESTLTFGATGVVADIMGYYACVFEHRDGSTTPQFDLTPAILLNATPGVITSCPAYSALSFAETFTLDICAESAELPTTTQSSSTTTEAQTTQFVTTTVSTDTVEESGLGEAAVYIGIATALVTSTCICVIGAIAYFIARVVRRNEQRQLRKIHVDTNVIDPRNNEEHHLRLRGCQACAI